MLHCVQLSVAASICTVLGALPGLLLRHVSHRGKDIYLLMPRAYRSDIQA